MSSPCPASQRDSVGTRADLGSGKPSGEGSRPSGIHSRARDRKPGQWDICKNGNLVSLGGCTVFLPSSVPYEGRDPICLPHSKICSAWYIVSAHNKLFNKYLMIGSVAARPSYTHQSKGSSISSILSYSLPPFFFFSVSLSPSLPSFLPSTHPLPHLMLFFSTGGFSPAEIKLAHVHPPPRPIPAPHRLAS